MRKSRKTAAVWVALATLNVALHAQTVDHVDVFRDAAVVTWSADAGDEGGRIARSFHGAAVGDVLLFPGGALDQWGAVRMDVAPWQTDAGEGQLRALTDMLENARVEWALKQAQLQLVEEDLALLRANRKVGGTSEAVLVEDLVEVADWMHDEMKDLLYRQVELSMEVEEKREEVEALTQQEREAQPRSAYHWKADWPAGATGDVATQVTEWSGGQYWTPSDVLELNTQSATPKLVWNRRAQVHLDVPVTGKAVPVHFHDARYGGLSERPDARPQTIEGYDRKVRDASDLGLMSAARSEAASARPGTRWTLNDQEIGPDWTRNVSLGAEELAPTLRFYTVPRQSPVVNLRLALPRPAQPVAEAEQALLMIDGVPVGKVWLSESGDSLLIDAGAARAWTVERRREAALCGKSSLGNRIKHHRAFRITVTNRSDRAGEVVVEEPLPISNSAEVEVVAETLDGGKLDEASGIVRWTVSLAAGESRTLQFAYDVSHGRDDRVPDLD